MPITFNQSRLTEANRISEPVRMSLRRYLNPAVLVEQDNAPSTKYDTDLKVLTSSRSFLIEIESRFKNSSWNTQMDFPCADTAHVPAERKRKLDGDLYLQIRSDSKVFWICSTKIIAKCSLRKLNPSNRDCEEIFYDIPRKLCDLYAVHKGEVLQLDVSHRYLENLLEEK